MCKAIEAAHPTVQDSAVLSVQLMSPNLAGGRVCCMQRSGHAGPDEHITGMHVVSTYDYALWSEDLTYHVLKLAFLL